METTITPAAHAMIREWVGPDPTPEDIERTARYMRDSLRIGGIRVCRALVLGAIKATQEVEATEFIRTAKDQSARRGEG